MFCFLERQRVTERDEKLRILTPWVTAGGRSARTGQAVKRSGAPSGSPGGRAAVSRKLKSGARGRNPTQGCVHLDR